MNAPDRAAWLEARKQGLGGSDIAAVLGISPWKTPYDLWLDKTGQSDDNAVGNEEAVYFGQALEDFVAREYARRSGATVQRVNTMLRHPQHDWMLANIDRAIVTPGSRARATDTGLAGADGVLECKTASAYKAGDWSGPDGSDAMPIYYASQVMWYLGVTGLPYADVAALIGGQKFVIKRVERDEETIRALIERAEHFWRHHVLGNIAPDPQNGADAARMFTKDDGSLLDIDNNADALAAVNDLRLLRTQAKEIEEQIETLTDRLKLAIGEHSGLQIGGQPVVTWKAAKDSTSTDWKALAAALNPSPELINQFTTTKPGSRRFLVK